MKADLIRTLQLKTNPESAAPYDAKIDERSYAEHEGPVEHSYFAEGIGRRIFQAAAAADGGQAKMAEVRAAANQLQTVIRSRGFLKKGEILVFGSCLVLGAWDGKSDVDFAVLVEDARKDPAGLVYAVNAALKDCGFEHDHLLPITRTRVPVIKYTSPNGYVALSDAVAGEHERSSLAPRTVLVEFTAPLYEDEKMAYERHARMAGTMGARGSDVEAFFWDPPMGNEPEKRKQQQRKDRPRPNTTVLITFTSTTACAAMLSRRNAREVPEVASARPVHERFRPELFTTDFDVTFNNVLGPRNSVLQRAMLQCHPAARPVFLVLKNWSKTAGINSGPTGYLTSYAFNIMWIYYLQRVANLAPYVNVEDVRPERFFDEKRGYLQHDPLVPNGAYDDTALKSLTADLLVDFFHFYGFRFNWETDVVSLNKRETTTKEELGWVPKEENGASGTDDRGRNVYYTMCIKDPYEENLTLGRNLTLEKCDEVKTALRKAYDALTADEGESTATVGDLTLADRTPDLKDFPLLSQFGAMRVSQKNKRDLYKVLREPAEGAIRSSIMSCINNETLIDAWCSADDTGDAFTAALKFDGGSFLSVAAGALMRTFGKAVYGGDKAGGDGKTGKANRPRKLKGDEGTFEAAVADAAWEVMSVKYEIAVKNEDPRVTINAEEVREIVRKAEEVSASKLPEGMTLQVLGDKLGLDSTMQRPKRREELSREEVNAKKREWIREKRREEKAAAKAAMVSDPAIVSNVGNQSDSDIDSEDIDISEYDGPYIGTPKEFMGWSHSMGLAHNAQAKAHPKAKPTDPVTLDALVYGHYDRMMQLRRNRTNVIPDSDDEDEEEEDRYPQKPHRTQKHTDAGRFRDEKPTKPSRQAPPADPAIVASSGSGGSRNGLAADPSIMAAGSSIATVEVPKPRRERKGDAHYAEERAVAQDELAGKKKRQRKPKVERVPTADALSPDDAAAAAKLVTAAAEAKAELQRAKRAEKKAAQKKESKEKAQRFADEAIVSKTAPGSEKDKPAKKSAKPSRGGTEPSEVPLSANAEAKKAMKLERKERQKEKNQKKFGDEKEKRQAQLDADRVIVEFD